MTDTDKTFQRKVYQSLVWTLKKATIINGLSYEKKAIADRTLWRCMFDFKTYFWPTFNVSQIDVFWNHEKVS